MKNIKVTQTKNCSINLIKDLSFIYEWLEKKTQVMLYLKFKNTRNIFLKEQENFAEPAF